jgi:hypothetical protein
VIVAEDITARFLNVIQLFNGAIPLIALKMTAYKVGDQTALTFVKVLGEQTLGLVDEDEPVAEPTDRYDWDAKASPKTLALTDDLLKLVKQVEPAAELKYNKHYIGLEVGGAARNFVVFRPRKAHVIVEFKLPAQGPDSKAALEDAALVPLAYDAQFGYHRVRVDHTVTDKQRGVLLQLAQQAHAGFGR